MENEIEGKSRFTIIKEFYKSEPSTIKRKYVECLCICGNTKEYRRELILKNKITNCGCLNKGKTNSHPKGEAYLTYLIKRCKEGVDRRCLGKIELSREEFKEIITKCCTYCGILPQTPTSKDSKTYNGVFPHNGIDRVNSDISYVLENCVSCCYTCNIMKNDNTLNYFIEQSNKIAACQLDFETHLSYSKEAPEEYEQLTRWIIRHYKSNAKQRDLEFNLTIDEVYALLTFNCFYCGNPPLIGKKPEQYFKGKLFFRNGIDRLDSNEGYIRNNCVACCKFCNIGKASMSPEEFITQAQYITSYQYQYEGSNIIDTRDKNS